MKDLIVNYELSRKLKNIGYDVPTAHSYIHNLPGKEYRLNLFTFMLGTDGYLGDIFANEKYLNNFKLDFIEDEHEVYFNYNQDFNKLLVKLLNGEDNMNDEKCLNMSTDSYTYHFIWDSQTKEDKKLLPNYNNGDFEFDVYQDCISAPRKDEVLKWFRDKYDLYTYVNKEYNIQDQFIGFYYKISKDDKTLFYSSKVYKTYQEAENELIEELIKIVDNKQ